MNTLYNANCFDVFPILKFESIDLVLCDMPYGTTACKWDSVLDLERMWKELKRVTKPHTPIVLTSSQPFTGILITSNIKQFKHEWIWEKAVGSNFAGLKYGPMKEHENILVFGKGTITYKPIMQERKGGEKGKTRASHKNPGLAYGTEVYGSFDKDRAYKSYGSLRNPSSVQFFNNRNPSDRGSHPTQKPVALIEYFIKTYSDEGDTVLDFCMGSGTTGVACNNTNRDFIGIELLKEYYDVACVRNKGE